MVQIGAGWAKGMRCLTPEGEKTRPTSSRVRSAVLNMTQGMLTDAKVLDLFAGSGAVGIEMLSRGATSATFVEKAPLALSQMRKNLEELERRAKSQNLASPDIKVLGIDVAVALERLLGESKSSSTFEVIYVDPPYRDAESYLKLLGEKLSQLCNPGGWLIFESAVALGEENPPPAHAWVLVKRKTYGDTMISIWEKR